MTEGFEVFVQEVIAAITTEPWATLKFSPLSETLPVLARSCV